MKEIIYLKNVDEKITARNRVAVLKKIIKCFNILANDVFVSQYIKFDNDARRWSPFDSTSGVMGKAIELLDPIRYYVDEEGEKEKVLSLHWLQCISYDVEKETYEKILEKVSMWAKAILSKLENRDFETEISYDATSEDNWL